MSARSPFAVAAGLFILGVVAGVPAAAPAPASRTASLPAWPELRAHRNSTGRITAFRMDRAIPFPSDLGASDRANLFLTQHNNAFVDSTTPLDVVVTRVANSHAHGTTVVRLQQRYAGIPVHGGEAIVHLTSEGVTGIRSNLVAMPPRLDVHPDISRERALELAAIAEAGTGDATLSIIDLAKLRGHGLSSWRLAWRVRGNTDVWIDAHTAQVLHRNGRIAHAFRLNLADNNNVCPSSPPLTGYDESSDFSAAPTAVVNAFQYLSASYRYFLDVLGRDGLSDASGEHSVQAVVRECADTFAPTGTGSALENAAWDSQLQTMFFDDGTTRADDIVGHEYAHAVIDHAARFEMTGQSGALAEAFADIFGELIDQRQSKDNDAGDVRWEFGEDAPGGPFRDFLNPSRYQQPEKITDSARYYCGFDADIAAHTNSSVLTHAFALLVEGGTFNGVSVTGIDADIAARIFHHTLSDRLTATATFGDAYEELLFAADDLIAQGQASEADKAELTNALNAVELYAPPCSTQLRYCPIGFAPVMTFYDGFEDIASGQWSNSTGNGVNHWNTGVGVPDIYHNVALDPKPSDLNAPAEVTVARRGKYGLWADAARDSSQQTRRLGDSSVVMTQPLAIPDVGGLFLQFENRFAFQTWESVGQSVSGPEPDGAVIEYSTDGTNWIDAGGLIVAGQGYSGTIQTDYGNPLAGRAAFVGKQPNYVSTRLYLEPLAGTSARFRFRVGTDSAGGDIGWFIDDVAAYTCTPSELVVFPTAGLVTTEDGGTATFDVSLAAMPNTAVVVSLASSNDAEGTVTPNRMIFEPGNWSVPQHATIHGVDDSLQDGTQSYVVNITINSFGDATFASSNLVSVGIENRDNDTSARQSKGGGDWFLEFLLITALGLRALGRSRP